MAIFRGVGGSGDSSDNSFLQEVTAQANAASASATAAANSATSALNTELTSASFNTSDGVLTLTKQDGDTVTADLDGRFLTSYTETDPVFTAHVANGITATNISNWNTAYNNHITAVDYSGSTLTLTQQDGGTLTTTINGALGSTLSHNGSTKIEAISSGVTVTGDITVSGTVDGRDLATDGTKLDGIEANATADQTDAEIKTAYENNADTNAFTDADHTKLNGIEANATADQTGSEIKSAYEAVADTNAFTDAEKTKLSGIEASADVTDTANVTAAGAVMDGDFTSNGFMKRTGAGTYAIDTSTYLTSFDITTQTDPKYLRSDAADTASGFINFTNGIGVTGSLGINGDVQANTFDGDNLDISKTGSVTTNISTGGNSSSTNIKNVNIGTGYNNGGTTNIIIGSTSTATTTNIDLNGDVELNGVPLQHVKRYSSDLNGFSFKYLNTTPSQVGDSYYSRTNNSPTKRFITIDVLVSYASGSGAKNLNVRCSLTATTANTVDIGNVFSITSPSSYNHTIEISGDVSHYFSEYSGCSANSNGTLAFTSSRAVYNPFTGRTIIKVGSYGATIPSVGDALYVHPFDWESSGTELIGLTHSHHVTPSSTTVSRHVNLHFYLGAYSPTTTVKIKAYEGSGDNVYISRLRLDETQEYI